MTETKLTIAELREDIAGHWDISGLEDTAGEIIDRLERAEARVAELEAFHNAHNYSTTQGSKPVPIPGLEPGLSWGKPDSSEPTDQQMEEFDMAHMQAHTEMKRKLGVDT